MPRTDADAATDTELAENNKTEDETSTVARRRFHLSSTTVWRTSGEHYSDAL